MFYLIHLELKIIEGLFLISENNYVQLAVSWYYICSLAFSPCLLKTAIDGHVTTEYIDWETPNITVLAILFVETRAQKPSRYV